jgi:hypothetical protein
MAIKGKSKSRGTRTVARGPKPAYVPIKTPWYRRRGLWLVIATVVAIAAIEGLVYGFARERTDERRAERRDRLAAAMNDFVGEIEPILTPIGNAVPPSSFDAFPALGGAIGGLEGEDVPAELLDAAGSAAEDTAGTARDSAALFEEVDVAGIVQDQGFNRSFVVYLFDARDGFARAMHLYREAALLTTMAVEAEEGEARDGLVARARGTHDLAEGAFAAAYSAYVNAQIAAGVFQPTNNGIPVTGATGVIPGLTGLTGFTGPTGATGTLTGATGDATGPTG